MNQILYKTVYEPNNYKYNRYKKNRFIIIFVIAIILIVIAIVFYLFMKYQLNQNEKLSKKLVSNYNIMTLYSESNDNSADSEETLNYKNDPFVIGLIQIDKINLTYPILSTTSDELLKISPCRFYRSTAKSNR